MTVYIPASSLMITQMEVFLGSEWCLMRYFGCMQGLVFFYLISFAPFQKNSYATSPNYQCNMLIYIVIFSKKQIKRRNRIGYLTNFAK